ncbi:MAG TPA: ribose-5-phosphate isomerase RpiA [Casimicrobiaceae bacterium]|nr:ribose-5-phosphate isomerase RpiA [Casimicrobiaceae bacterium]
MTQDEQKKAVAKAAMKYVVDDAWIGVGSGSTANYFIDELAARKAWIKGAVSSSEKSTARLRSHGIEVEDLNNVSDIPVYVDGADEVTRQGAMVKGGGGALTREKIVAAVASRFVCIVDGSKLVPRLGAFPVPIEVIPMARSYVAREIVRRGGKPAWRMGFTTDNGNVILDVSGWSPEDPAALERELDGIAGVVTVGLFARRGADTILIGRDDAVETLKPSP